jgi:SAM-dependent methyltransferase
MSVLFSTPKRSADRAARAAMDVAIRLFPPLSRAAQPARFIRFGGGGDYIVQGDGLVGGIVRQTGLCAGHTVLDIGCGIGRNATALYRRFGETIEYRGFDIVRHGVTWCREHFAPLSDRYVFDRADIYNSAYNPSGRLRAEDYVFPYPDQSADVAFATSVFTHMQPAGVARYLGEAARVLKDGGVAYFTFFILDEHARAQIASGRASFSFRHALGDCRVEKASEPDGVVAYPLAWVRATLAGAGFAEPLVLTAGWRDGRGADGPSFQDVVIARKPA